MKVFKEKGFQERLSASNAAKQALLEKFKTKPADDPAALERAAQRKAIVQAREAREAEKRRIREEKKRQEEEEKARIAAEEQARIEAEAEERRLLESQKAESDNARIARLLADEAERKAKRDAKYAARKARVKSTR